MTVRVEPAALLGSRNRSRARRHVELLVDALDVGLDGVVGETELVAPLAGASLPTAAWQPGQLIRVTVQLPVDRIPTQAGLSVNDESIALEELP